LDRGVAFVGVPPDDERRIRAAIGTMTVAKLLPTPWRISAVEEADLVIMAPDSAAARVLFAGPALRHGAVTAALVAAADAQQPPQCERLPWPVRANDLRDLLLKVEAHVVGGAEDSTGLTVPRPGSHGPLLQLARLLRAVNEASVAPRSAWRIRGIAPTPLYVAPGTTTFVYAGSVMQLRHRLSGDSLEITRIAADEVPLAAGGKPLVMLQWLVGVLLGQHGLLPWIDPDAVHRLTGEPDFTILQHTSAHRRIAALLVKEAALIPDILRLAQVDQESVHELLNAASLTGKLVTPGVPPAAGSKASTNTGKVLLRHLRHAFRLVLAR
jgi:hypothetical protein